MQCSVQFFPTEQDTHTHMHVAMFLAPMIVHTIKYIFEWFCHMDYTFVLSEKDTKWVYKTDLEWYERIFILAKLFLSNHAN